MNRTRAAIVVVVLFVVAGAVASVAVLGPLSGLVGDLPETADDAGPTPTPVSGGDADGDAAGGGTGGDDGGDSASTATEREPFGITIVSVEECGETCRDVTIRVTNRLEEPAEGVHVVSRIFAGKRDDDGDELWEGEEDLGTIDGTSSVTVEKRVELGFVDAAKVKNNDGWITVRTTVTSAGVEATYVEEKQVA